MKIIPVIAVVSVFAGQIARSEEKGLKIVFDNRPESGIPREASEQQAKRGKKASKQAIEKDNEEPKQPISTDFAELHELTADSIKVVRIRYFDKDIWATEEEASAYVRGFLEHKSLNAGSFQMWSQVVGVPAIECLIDFTDEHRKKLRDKGLFVDEGRLLIWNTEACFRDATGRWWFVNAFDHFHAAHPKGNRDLVKPTKLR